MKMKRYIMIMAGLVLFSACTKEEKLEGDFTYGGPNPPITEGTTPAQNLCYELYQKYDFHLYYTLSGDEALQTPLSKTQTNAIITANSSAIPMQAADEVPAYKLLNMLKTIYSLFPDAVVTTNMYKRHVLVKVNPGDNKTYDNQGNLFYNNIYTDPAMNGTIYFGDLDATIATPNYKGWIIAATYNFLFGITYPNYKNVTFPKEFGAISDGFYRNDTEDSYYLCFESDGKYKVSEGYSYGFVHPKGASAKATSPHVDIITIATWLLTTPQNQIDEIVNNSANYRLQQKCTIVINFFQDTFGVDLEALNPTFNAITIN